MATVLHIQASPMGDLSYSKRLARAFLDSYGSAHREDRIVTLELWKETLPPFDFVAASGKYKIIRGMPHSEEEASAWKRVLEMIDQFKGADKVVVSTGMWNFSIPYRLKQYLDVIVQPGHTFGFDPEKGYFGLVTGKPLMLLLASGGEYPEGTPGAQFDYQKPYLEMIFRFMGFTDVRTLRSEGTLGPGAETNHAAAEAAAIEAVKEF
jgi:FMN-dependent NADH-azoreductase